MAGLPAQMTPMQAAERRIQQSMSSLTAHEGAFESYQQVPLPGGKQVKAGRENVRGFARNAVDAVSFLPGLAAEGFTWAGEQLANVYLPTPGQASIYDQYINMDEGQRNRVLGGIGRRKQVKIFMQNGMNEQQAIQEAAKIPLETLRKLGWADVKPMAPDASSSLQQVTQFGQDMTFGLAGVEPYAKPEVLAAMSPAQRKELAWWEGAGALAGGLASFGPLGLAANAGKAAIRGGMAVAEQGKYLIPQARHALRKGRQSVGPAINKGAQAYGQQSAALGAARGRAGLQTADAAMQALTPGLQGAARAAGRTPNVYGAGQVHLPKAVQGAANAVQTGTRAAQGSLQQAATRAAAPTIQAVKGANLTSAARHGKNARNTRQAMAGQAVVPGLQGVPQATRGGQATSNLAPSRYGAGAVHPTKTVQGAANAVQAGTRAVQGSLQQAATRAAAPTIQAVKGANLTSAARHGKNARTARAKAAPAGVPQATRGGQATSNLAPSRYGAGAVHAPRAVQGIGGAAPKVAKPAGTGFSVSEAGGKATAAIANAVHKSISGASKPTMTAARGPIKAGKKARKRRADAKAKADKDLDIEAAAIGAKEMAAHMRRAGRIWRAGAAGRRAKRAAQSMSFTKKAALVAGLPLIGSGYGTATAPEKGSPEHALDAARFRGGIGLLGGAATPFLAKAGVSAIAGLKGAKDRASWKSVKDKIFKEAAPEDKADVGIDAQVRRAMDEAQGDLKTLGLDKVPNVSAGAAVSLGPGQPSQKVRRLGAHFGRHNPEGMRNIAASVESTKNAVLNKAQEIKSSTAQSAAVSKLALNEAAAGATGSARTARESNAAIISQAIRKNRTSQHEALAREYKAIADAHGKTKFGLFPQGMPTVARDKNGNIMLSKEAKDEVDSFFGKSSNYFTIPKHEIGELDDLMRKTETWLLYRGDSFTIHEGMEIMRRLNRIQRDVKFKDSELRNRIMKVKDEMYTRLSESLPPEINKRYVKVQGQYAQFAGDFEHSDVVRRAIGQREMPQEYSAEHLARIVMNERGKLNSKGYEWLTRVLGGNDEAAATVNKLALDEFNTALGPSITRSQHSNMKNQLRRSMHDRANDSPGYGDLDTAMEGMLNQRLVNHIARASDDTVAREVSLMDENQFDDFLRALGGRGKDIGERVRHGLLSMTDDGARARETLRLAPRLERMGVDKQQVEVITSLARMLQHINNKNMLMAPPRGSGLAAVYNKFMETAETWTGTKMSAMGSIARSVMHHFVSKPVALVGTIIPNINHNMVGRQVINYLLNNSLKNPEAAKMNAKMLKRASAGDTVKVDYKKWIATIAANIEKPVTQESERGRRTRETLR